MHFLGLRCLSWREILRNNAAQAKKERGRALTPALTPQLELLGSPPDSVGRFAMREDPSAAIVAAQEAVFRRAEQLMGVFFLCFLWFAAARKTLTGENSCPFAPDLRLCLRLLLLTRKKYSKGD